MISGQEGNVGSDVGSNQADVSNPVASNDAVVVSPGATDNTSAPGGVNPQSPPVVEAPAYQPNFKYRAFQEEKEFPEWARSFVKSKDHEENLRSLLCKADGLDGLKPKYQELRNQHGDLSTRWSTLAKYAKDDLHSFFEATGIERQRLVDWLIKSEETQRDPERKQAWESQRAAELQQRDIQSRFDSQQSQLEQVMAQNHQIELRTVTTDPDVSSFAKAFDEKLGEGAFLAHVYNVGNTHFLETKKNLSPVEAVSTVIRQYHRLVSAGGASASPQPNVPGQSSDGKPVIAPVKPIPTLGNGSSHTGKTKIKSLADLHRRAEELGRQEG